MGLLGRTLVSQWYASIHHVRVALLVSACSGALGAVVAWPLTIGLFYLLLTINYFTLGGIIEAYPPLVAVVTLGMVLMSGVSGAVSRAVLSGLVRGYAHQQAAPQRRSWIQGWAVGAALRCGVARYLSVYARVPRIFYARSTLLALAPRLEAVLGGVVQMWVTWRTHRTPPAR